MKISVSILNLEIFINIVFAVASNKVDLFDKEQISEEEGANFAEEKKAIFYMVSAYSGAGIDSLFEKIGMKCLNLKENENLQNRIKLNKTYTTNKEEYKQKCCTYY